MSPERSRSGERAVRRCHACERQLTSAADVGWECDCSVVVCTDPECFDEYFKLVADGEGTRCRTCGLLM